MINESIRFLYNVLDLTLSPATCSRPRAMWSVITVIAMNGFHWLYMFVNRLAYSILAQSPCKDLNRNFRGAIQGLCFMVWTGNGIIY